VHRFAAVSVEQDVLAVPVAQSQDVTDLCENLQVFNRARERRVKDKGSPSFIRATGVVHFEHRLQVSVRTENTFILLTT